MKKAAFFILIALQFISSMLARPTVLLAYESEQSLNIPEFGYCPSPNGELVASYTDGVHGVPGDPTTYTGSDSVFKLNENQLVQCLCPANTQGVQTWWWKPGQISEADEADLINQGWIRVPNGALWGLDEAVYFAKNLRYDCTTGTGGGSGGTGGSSSSSSSGTGGSVAGASVGQILGAYAQTGNLEEIALLSSAGLALLILSWILKKAV